MCKASRMFVTPSKVISSKVSFDFIDLLIFLSAIVLWLQMVQRHALVRRGTTGANHQVELAIDAHENVNNRVLHSSMSNQWFRNMSNHQLFWLEVLIMHNSSLYSSPPIAIEQTIQQFFKLKPLSYVGTYDFDQLLQWIETTEDKFALMSCMDENKVLFCN